MNAWNKLNDSAVKDLVVDVVLGLEKLESVAEDAKNLATAMNSCQWLYDAVKLIREGDYKAAYEKWRQNYDHLCVLLHLNVTCANDAVMADVTKKARARLRDFLDGQGKTVIELIGKHVYYPNSTN